MGKGMSFEDFKSALSSDATIENEKLKRLLNELKTKSETEIAELKEENEQYKKWCKSLGNRCFAQARGLLCISCNVECCDFFLTSEDWDMIQEYMNKNLLQRTPDTYEKISQFVVTNIQKNKLEQHFSKKE